MQFSRNLFFRPLVPSGPRGHRAYVVGDVHGRLDLLDVLLNKIEDDVRSRRRCRISIVFLGDLIDRGPDSAGVVERLRCYRPPFAKTMFVLGNHEEVMIRAVEGDADVLRDWLKFGGGECVRSYGIDPMALKRMLPVEAAATITSAVPAEHVEFLRSFADTVSFGNYVFVHAGVRPGTSLGEQSSSDLRWIREPFLTDERDHGYVVVHGHTISQGVDLRSNRIGIDTGAYRTGVLTALAIEGTERWFLQTGGAMPENGWSGRKASSSGTMSCGDSV